jgi:hypothetical protein
MFFPLDIGQAIVILFFSQQDMVEVYDSEARCKKGCSFSLH